MTTTPTWSVPEYEYRRELLGEQFHRLFKQFLDANRGDPSPKTAFKRLSTSAVEAFAREPTDPLPFAKYFPNIEEVTGIDIDRLMVIDAKLKLIEMWKERFLLRRRNESLAFLLDQCADLPEKVDFDQYPTRDEIVLEIQLLSDEIGSPMVAQQMFVNQGTVTKWWAASKPGRPAGETLIKCIALLTAGPVRFHGEISSRDDVRFRLVVRNLLGCDPHEVLGVRNLPEAIAALDLGDIGDMISVVENRTGLGATTIKNLRKWNAETSSGKMPAQSMLKIIRLLLERAHPDKLKDFDAAGKLFLDAKNLGWGGTPLFWPKVVQQPKEPAPEPKPEPAPPAAQQPEESAPAPEPKPAMRGKTPSSLELLEFKRALVTLEHLTELFPGLLDLLPETLRPTPEPQPVAEPEPPPVAQEPPANGVTPEVDLEKLGPKWFIALVESDRRPTAGELSQISAILRAYPKLIGRLLGLPVEQRRRFFRGVDGSMLATAERLQAVDATEPERFLNFLDHTLEDRFKAAGG